MGVRSNGVAFNHGDVNEIDGATALTWIWTCMPLADGSIPGLTKGTTFFIAYESTANYAMGVSGAWETRSTDATRTTNTAHRVAYRYDGSQGTAADRLDIWEDGVALTMTGTATPTSLPSSTSVLEVCKNTTGAVDGNVADLKMWEAVLTEAEILQEIYSSRPIRTANLVLWVPYNNAGDLVDYSGNGYNGTNASATTVHMRTIEIGAPILVL